MRIIYIFIFLFLANFRIYSQYSEGDNFPLPDTPREIQAIKTTETIKIDGILNEDIWKTAPFIDDFFRIEPRQGGAYNHQTKVSLLYDQKNLYIGAFCEDSIGKEGIRAQDLRRDFNNRESDNFAIQLDPQNLKQYCVSFQATPYGNQLDLQNFNDNNTDFDWNALWSVRTHRTDSGYYAEFAIPFKSLRYNKPNEGDSVEWGITFSRLARRDFEQTVFPAIPQSFSPYRMTYAAKLKGLEVPNPSANIRIDPYVLYQFEQESADGLPKSDDALKLGGEIKWAINPQSVLDLTVNTDFAQAEVDRAVNNLERFNIFFPERRQFFLENSGIWAGSSNNQIVPFFTRSIGLQGDFNASKAPINFGSRFTMRNKNETVAGLFINQAETANSATGNFAVGRYLRNYGKENNIGIMMTHRLDEKSAQLGLKQQNNSTLTIDGLIRPKSEWTISYMMSSSRDNSNDSIGLSGRFFTGYFSNKFYLGWLSNFVSEKYTPDMGFVYQKNVVQHNPGGYYIWRPKNISWIRRFDPGIFVNFYHDVTQPKNFQQAELYIFPIYLFFTNGSFVEYAIKPTWQNINFNFAPLGIPIEQDNYNYTRHQVRLNSDQSAKFSFSGLIDWGDFYNGQRLTLKGGLRYAPIPHIAITANHEFNDLKELGSSESNLQTKLTTIGTRFALNPRIQLSAFYQYNSFDKTGRVNIRGSWEYQPLSFIYLVFNDTQTDMLDSRFAQQQFISKVTFVKQF